MRRLNTSLSKYGSLGQFLNVEDIKKIRLATFHLSTFLHFKQNQGAVYVKDFISVN